MVENKKNRFLNIIILSILIFTPIIDIIYSVNYYILGFKVPIHLALRCIILMYVLINIKRRKSIIFLMILSSGLALGIVFPIIMRYPFDLIDNLSYTMKIINFVAFAFYFDEKLKENKVNINILLNYISYSTIIISSNIVLSNIFKFGFKTYLDKPISGHKGFFMIHNSITAVLLIVIPISFYTYYKNRKSYNLIIFILNVMAVMMIGTKSGVIGAVSIIFMILLTIIIEKELYLKIKFTKKVLCKIVVGSSILIIISGPIINKFYLEQKKQYESMGYDNFYSYIISNRNLQIKYINKEIENKLTFNPKYMFGMGIKYANDVIHSEKKEFEIIEMDFNGVAIYSGYLVLIIILLLIFKIYIGLLMAIRDKTNIFLKLIMLISLSIGIIHAAFGGHVLYEGITGVYFGICLGVSSFLGSELRIKEIIEVIYNKIIVERGEVKNENINVN